MSNRFRRIGAPLLGAAVAAIVLAGIAGANNGDPLVIGQGNTGTNTTKLTANASGPALHVVNSDHLALRGESSTARGVLGQHTAATGADPGVQGQTASGADDAYGVFGQVTASTPGAGSAGVYGKNAGTPVSPHVVYGVYGSAPSGDGIGGSGRYGAYGLGTKAGVFGFGVSFGGGAVGVLGYGNPGSEFHGTPAVLSDGDVVVSGAHYVQLHAISGAPPAADCDSSGEAGRLVARTVGTPHLYVCLGSGGWFGLS